MHSNNNINNDNNNFEKKSNELPVCKMMQKIHLNFFCYNKKQKMIDEIK